MNKNEKYTICHRMKAVKELKEFLAKISTLKLGIKNKSIFMNPRIREIPRIGIDLQKLAAMNH